MNNIYQSTKVMPYVYMCIHKVTGQFYIGYREDNVRLNRTSDVDLPRYKSSSKIVKPSFQDYDWHIVAECNTGIDAYDLEQQIIFENWGNSLLINKSCQYGNKKRFKCSNKGRKQSAAHVAKLTAIRQNRVLPADFGQRVSDALKGKPKTEQHKKNAGAGNKGKKRDDAAREKIRLARAKQVITPESRIKAAATRAQNKRSTEGTRSRIR